MFRLNLFALAIGLAVAIVLLGHVLTDILIGKPPLQFEFLGWGEILVMFAGQVAFASIPMLVLAAKDDKRVTMWVVASVLTVGSWTYYAWRVWRASLVNFAGGADIGLGIAMMLAPLFVLLILLVTSAMLRSITR